MRNLGANLSSDEPDANPFSGLLPVMDPFFPPRVYYVNNFVFNFCGRKKHAVPGKKRSKRNDDKPKKKAKVKRKA